MAVQDESTQKTIAISLNALRFSGHMLQQGIRLLLQQKEHGIKAKKQTLRSLIKKGEKLTNLDLRANTIKDFVKIAKNYQVAFSVMKGEKDENGLTNFVIFFRADDVERMDAALKQYAQKTLSPEKPSILDKLQQAREAAQQNFKAHEHIPKREKGVEL